MQQHDNESHFDLEWLDTPEQREADEVTRIIIRFAQEMLNDDRDGFTEFYFGCASDRIQWDEEDFSDLEIAPPVVIGLDFEELGKGQFNALTPEGLSGLLFRGRYRRRFNKALEAALLLERERVRDGINSTLHIPDIETHMIRARKAILASFRAAERQLFPASAAD